MPDIQIDGGRFLLANAPTASGANGYQVKLTNADFLPGGSTTNAVTFRLCTDASCTTVYPGSTKTFSVNLNVKLKDWATFQRDAAHTAYVAVKYNAANFRPTPVWSVPSEGSAPSAVAACQGSVFANFQQGGTTSSHSFTRAFASASGVQQWSYDLGQVGFNVSAPSCATAA